MTEKPTAPFARVYGPARQALEAHDCPTCTATAGEPCIGVQGYVWQKSKVHAARLALHTTE